MLRSKSSCNCAKAACSAAPSRLLRAGLGEARAALLVVIAVPRPQRLAHAVRDLDDKATLQADLQTKQVRVETTAPDEAVAEAMRDAGFTVEAA